MENGKRFRLFFPISLNVFMELLDSTLDLMTLICIFAPKPPNSGSRISVHTVNEIIQMLIDLLGSITQDGPYDLLDVVANNVKVSIKIR